MKVHFKTPTLLSYIDLMSMGGSEKVDDATKLGSFCSGLKYSMALAIRHGVGFSVSVYDSVFSDGFDRKRKTLYTTDVYTEYCEQTGKEKELIKIVQSVSSENFHSGHTCDYGGGELPDVEIPTGYSVKMGIDWKLYMLLREVYSNMLDEGGSYCEDSVEIPKYGTIVTLEFDEENPFYEVWENRHLYINEKEPLHVISSRVECLSNPEGYLRIYKQNILVLENKDVPSRFAYNIKFGEIDERRVLSNVYSVEGTIVESISNTKNEEFLREIITPDFKTQEGEFLSNRDTYYTASDIITKIANEVNEEHGNVQSYKWLIDSIKKRKDCKIKGRIIQTVEDSIWTYNSKVTIESTPEKKETSSVKDEIEEKYNFKLEVEISTAELKGSKVIADNHNNCLIMDNEFNVETDMSEFFVQYICLTRKGNVVKNMGDYIAEILIKNK